jgi:hypothetical protein
MGEALPLPPVLEPHRSKQTFIGCPKNVCLDLFVFAEFFRKTGKAIPDSAGTCFCELCLDRRGVEAAGLKPSPVAEVTRQLAPQLKRRPALPRTGIAN